MPIRHNTAFRFILRSATNPISEYDITWVKIGLGGAPNTSVVPEILSDFTEPGSTEIVMDWMPGTTDGPGEWAVEQYDPARVVPGVERVQRLTESTLLSPVSLGGVLLVDSATTVTLTLPAEADEVGSGFRIGSTFEVVQQGVGIVDVATTATLVGPVTGTTAQWDRLQIRKIAADTWMVLPA